MRLFTVLLILFSMGALLTTQPSSMPSQETSTTTTSTITTYTWGITVSTDKSTYGSSDIVQIAGSVSGGPSCGCPSGATCTCYPGNIIVELEIRNVIGTVVYSKALTLDPYSSIRPYSDSFSLSSALESGNYQVVARASYVGYSDIGYPRVEARSSFRLEGTATTRDCGYWVVATDKEAYSTGEIVHITGHADTPCVTFGFGTAPAIRLSYSSGSLEIQSQPWPGTTCTTCGAGGSGFYADWQIPSTFSPGTVAIIVFDPTWPDIAEGATTFAVTAALIERLFLSPTSGPLGTAVSVSGLGFRGTTCNLSSSPSGLFSLGSCSISAGTLTGGFPVTATGGSALYVVTVTTNAGESANATFYLINDNVYMLSLSPTSGSLGTTVFVTGAGYAGTTCVLSSSPSGLMSSASCSIPAGTLTASFTVAPGASTGSYVVTVTTNKGETVSAGFTVTPPGYLSVDFDKATYHAGDTVHIAGGLRAYTSWCTWTFTSGLAVPIIIHDPSGLLVLNSTTNPSFAGGGEYAYDYALPASAAFGTYTVDVSSGFPCGAVGPALGHGTFQVTSSTAPLTSPATTAPPPGPGIPGFSIEAILVGLVGGLVALTLVRRGRSGRSR